MSLIRDNKLELTLEEQLILVENGANYHNLKLIHNPYKEVIKKVITHERTYINGSLFKVLGIIEDKEIIELLMKRDWRTTLNFRYQLKVTLSELYSYNNNIIHHQLANNAEYLHNPDILDTFSDEFLIGYFKYWLSIYEDNIIIPFKNEYSERVIKAFNIAKMEIKLNNKKGTMFDDE